MQISRVFGLVLLTFVISSGSLFASDKEKAKAIPENEAVAKKEKNSEVKAETKVKPERSAPLAETTETKKAVKEAQQLVESVDIQGNRRLKDQDLLYYIRTRPGDTYDKAVLERDLKELLSLKFFDKTETRVLTQPGVRGGVNVIFEVKELPIIRDLQFEGTKAIQESDILKSFRENRIGISKEETYDPVKARNARRILREMLASKGYPNAKITVEQEEVSATSTAITFVIEQGNRSRIVKIEFEGNEVFKDGELRGQLQLVQETGLISRFKGQDILDLRKLEFDLQKNVREYMFSKGYFQARIGEPQVEGLGYKRTGPPILKVLPLPLITSKDDTLKIIVPVNEGKIFRIGEIKIEGNSIFSEQQISSIIGVKTGEIADGKRLRKALFEDLKTIYGGQGFIEYDVELNPVFKDNPNKPGEGIVDIDVQIIEGKQFRLRKLEFVGNTFTRDIVLRREMLLNEQDIYNQIALERSIIRLNQTQYFDPIDKDQDIETRADSEQGQVDAIVKVRERGRQQISFNGGVSGLSGTFFGLEYSTNNLLGRGETLAFNFGAGNRQQSIQVSFTEPYFQDRPITVGFSIFASRYKFFGEGTFLSQNQDAITGALNPLGSLVADEATLFTQTTYGASLFATAPLSEIFFKKRAFTQFSRIGLTYQFTATTITDPPINESQNAADRIPVIFAQPNIITSRVTPTFVYDTRQPTSNGIDTLRGTQISASIALAGLGGDVRTYQPNITFTKFIPVRNKKSDNAQVFGFRLQAGTIGAFSIKDKIRNSNSVSFVGGVPLFERYFLGSEFDVRGYNSRSIGPIAAYDSFLTSRNIVVASNLSGEANEIEGIPAERLAEIAQLGILNGPGGSQDALFQQNFRFIGGDTRLLGNFEYRVPIFGPLSMAAFADIGAVFNLRKTGTQQIDSAFLRDDLLVGPGSLGAVAIRNYPQLLNNFGTLLYYQDQLLTNTQFRRLFCPSNACPDSIPAGVESLFLRGEVQTNSILDVDNAAFNNIGDFRSTIGLEARIQVPVVNVPFRLIYFYNPNAKLGRTEEVPGLFLPGKRSGLRFSVGRTF